MNQDYFGLNAEVGIQVNGGAWFTVPMNYVGRVDNNSKWQVTPSSAFPVGAVVTFYFHGFDSWGGNTWDSANSQNYSFVIPPANTNLAWGNRHLLPMNPTYQVVSNGTFRAYPTYADMAAFGGVEYAVWQEGEYNYSGSGASPTVWFSKRAKGSSWEIPQKLANGTQPKIAVAGSGVHVVYNGSAYLRSTNSGATWSAVTNYGVAGVIKLRADADYVYALGGSQFPNVLTLAKKNKNAANWDTPVAIYTNYVDYSYGPSLIDFEIAGSKIAVSTFIIQQYHGPPYYYGPYFHESSDGGRTWTEVTNFPGDYYSDLDIGADGQACVLTLAKDTSNEVKFYKRQGPGWSQGIALFEAAQGDVSQRLSAGLQLTDGGLVAVAVTNGTRVYRASADNGATWSPAKTAGAPPSSDGSIDDAADGNDIHLLTRPMSTWENPWYSVAGSEPATGQVAWAGLVYNFPANGDTRSTDSLWVNVDSWPADAAASARVLFTTDSRSWSSVDLLFGGKDGNNDWWHGNIGSFPAGAVVQYKLEVTDRQGNVKTLNNSGTNYIAAVNAAAHVTWVGNSYTWPVAGVLDGSPLWINTQSWPAGAGLRATATYSMDHGATWATVSLDRNGKAGNNDAWHRDLYSIWFYTFPAYVLYYVEVEDGFGVKVRDDNHGQYYRVDYP